MRKKFIAQAVTLYDPEEQMVIGTVLLYETKPIPWMPSDGILVFNGDGYDSDAGYIVYVLLAGEGKGRMPESILMGMGLTPVSTPSNETCKKVKKIPMVLIHGKRPKNKGASAPFSP